MGGASRLISGITLTHKTFQLRLLDAGCSVTQVRITELSTCLWSEALSVWASSPVGGSTLHGNRHKILGNRSMKSKKPLPRRVLRSGETAREKLTVISPWD